MKANKRRERNLMNGNERKKKMMEPRRRTREGKRRDERGRGRAGEEGEGLGRGREGRGRVCPYCHIATPFHLPLPILTYPCSHLPTYSLSPLPLSLPPSSSYCFFSLSFSIFNSLWSLPFPPLPSPLWKVSGPTQSSYLQPWIYLTHCGCLST